MKEYSFSEKFFKIQPEGRIRRYQFLTRTLFISLVAYWVVYLLTTLMSPMNVFAINIAYYAASLHLTYFMYILMVKRINDIGWKLPWLAKVVTGISCIIIVLLMFMDISGLFMSISSLMKNIELILMVSSFIIYIRFFIGIFTLILIFYPGKTGDNEFGKDPVNTKISFFG